MKALCVMLGANLGVRPEYIEAVKKLGMSLSERKIKLVYGGGRLGLMGILADTVLQNGGSITGVITNELCEKELHFGVTDMHVVQSMQERKKLMMQFSDGFMVLPGGIGTLEEMFEVLNAAKLGLHTKPIGLLNSVNYFDKLIEFFDYSIKEDFSKSHIRELIKISSEPDTLLALMEKKNASINNN